MVKSIFNARSEMSCDLEVFLVQGIDRTLFDTVEYFRFPPRIPNLSNMFQRFVMSAYGIFRQRKIDL